MKNEEIWNEIKHNSEMDLKRLEGVSEQIVKMCIAITELKETVETLTKDFEGLLAGLSNTRLA